MMLLRQYISLALLVRFLAWGLQECIGAPPWPLDASRRMSERDLNADRVDADESQARTMALDPSLEEQQLVEAAFQRRGTPLHARERRAEALLGGGFVVGCALVALLSPPTGVEIDPAAALLCALALAVAVRVHFIVGPGYTVPTQLAFVPLAFAIPPALLAPATACVFAAAQLADVSRGRLPLSRVALVPGNTWFALGPAVVLAAAGGPQAGEATMPVLLAAVAAQVAIDAIMSGVRDVLHGGLNVRALLDDAWLYGVDLALTPVGFIVALALPTRPWAVLAIVPLLGILAVFARERDARMHGLAELNAAYRGTALVLGDVVEADDGYTGEHCRAVVDLALDAGRHLALPAGRLRNLEFAALLHDVGKVSVPKRIINKPGALDEDEWMVMRRHTIEGQRMLDRVGGFMRDVGVIVRAHHERWDGTGYPDGLAGEAIPLESRIIACCDAWNAMTTTRAYRPALPEEVAMRELRINAGSQFDPQVVAAVLAVAPTALRAHEFLVE
jgi:HD-GYP domain-containing protein (c-di-GMP phosphodiesterase class II)